MTDIDVYSAMQTGDPFKTYKKAILGKVQVVALDPFSDKPVNVIMKGDPKKNEEGCFIDVWNERQDVFLQRMNIKLIKEGVILPFDRGKTKIEPEINKYNVLTDDELVELLSKPFFTLQKTLQKMTSPSPVYRLQILAEQEEKSEKIINLIKGRLSELQEVEFTNAS